MSGYDTMFRALQILGDEYDRRTKYADIDWGATLRKIFGGKKSGGTIDESGALFSLNANGQPMTPEEQANYNEFRSTIPRTSQNYIDPSQFSPDNPLLEEVAKINKGGFLVRRPTGALIAGLEDYERNKDREAIAEQLSELELERRRLELDALKNPRTFSYDPSQYIGQFSAKNPWASYLSNPANFSSQKEVAEAYENAVKWEEDQKPKPSSNSNINLYRQYQSVQDAYNQYVKAVKARDEFARPLRFEDWIRQPENAAYLRVHNEFMGSNLQSLPSRLSTLTPEQKAAKEKSKVQSQKPSYQPNEDYGPEVWAQTDEDVKKFGGPGTALTYYLKNGGATPQRVLALLDRYNQNLKRQGIKKQYTLAEYKKRFVDRKK